MLGKQFSRLIGVNIAHLILLTGGGLALLWGIYFAVVTLLIPYQIEYREGAALVMTDLLLRGENPFGLANQPLAMNNYGLGYALGSLPLAALVGNTLLAHRAVTLLFIILTCLLGVWGMYKTGVEIAPALAANAFIVIGLIAQGGIGAFPSATGTFFFSAALWLPLLGKFDKRSLFASAVFALAAFYTKPYFLLAFGVVASYMFFFVSKQKAVVYGFFFLFLFAAALLFVRMLLPLYFITTIVGNISNTQRSISYLFEQLTQLLFYFYPVVILTACAGFKRRSSNPALLAGWRQPLFDFTADYFLYAFVTAFAAFVFVLGLHVGAYLTYFYQIALPPFFYWLLQRVDFKNRRGILLAALMVFNLFWWESSALDAKMLEQRNSTHWQRLYAYLYKPARILNAPPLAAKAVTSGFDVFDSGQTDYFYFVQPYADNPLLGVSYAEFQKVGLAYSADINRAIQNREFDLVFTVEGMEPFFDMNILRANYAMEKEIKVDMPQTNQYWPLAVWRPKE